MIDSDRCEIRTRATEVTGALNQRLRPLGQPAMFFEVLPARVVARDNDMDEKGSRTCLLKSLQRLQTEIRPSACSSEGWR